MECGTVNKVYEGRPDVTDMMKDEAIHLVMNTTEGAQAIEDSRSMRNVTLMDKIPYFTTAAAAHATEGRLPVVILPDDSILLQPSKSELAEAAGIHSVPEAPFYDLAIVGGGPAGLAAAVYGASEGLSTVLLEREAPGGQAGTSSRIENYLGFPKGVSGSDLARRAIAQATRLGAELITPAEVADVRIGHTVKTIVLTDKTELKCRALVVASGMTVRKLNVPGYDRFEGAGVYYGAAATEAATYQSRHVYVIGGANSAGQAAVMFSKTSSKVTMVVRSDSLEQKMSQYLVDQIGTIEFNYTRCIDLGEIHCSLACG